MDNVMNRKIFTTPRFHLGAHSLFKPSMIDHPGVHAKPKFYCQALFTDLANVKQFFMKDVLPTLPSSWQDDNLRRPLRPNLIRGGEELDKTYPAYLSMRTPVAPALYNESLGYRELLVEEATYPGCICTAEFQLFKYDFSAETRGLSAVLLSVTKVADVEVTQEQAAELISYAEVFKYKIVERKN